MYDRAPRWFRLAHGGSTEEHVGPGSYQVPFPKPRATGQTLVTGIDAEAVEECRYWLSPYGLLNPIFL
ncbi:hypothetical protein U0070_010199 [Myodes glareolus]|uniref:Uncharacterized protein n=1 Tax=Myodes glareolus TaxID=447135 RepID=A0AAW0I8V6_MYOGA